MSRGKEILAIFGSVALGALLCALLLFWEAGGGEAQVSTIQVDKRLGRASPVVKVGETLTFTIDIVNTWGVTIEVLPLRDVFNETVLTFAFAEPPPDSIAPPQLDWNDLTTTFGDLGIGQSCQVVVGFIAVHPAEAVVNFAEVHDAVGSGTSESGSGGGQSPDSTVEGSKLILDKNLVSPPPPIFAGMRITFETTIVNDGACYLVTLPFTDTYDPAHLTYVSAYPEPTLVDTAAGLLYWEDLTNPPIGDLAPGQAITLTAVFIAETDIDVSTSNSVQVGHAKDEFGNELAAGQDEVSIIIIGPTPTFTPGEIPSEKPTPIPTATPTPTWMPVPLTPYITPTPFTVLPASATPQLTGTPARLPTTGAEKPSAGGFTFLLLALIALGTGLYLVKGKEEKE